jgi:Anti-sigma factor NepR
MPQERDVTVRHLIGTALNTQYDEIADEPLPQRWVDLIHYLDEKERKATQARTARLRRK